MNRAPCVWPLCTGPRVKTVYFGVSIADADAAGFNELQLPAAELLRLGGSSVELIGGTMIDECRELFDNWLSHPERRAY